MSKQRHVGFTLIELLVVIGIIAVLISILLSALRQTRMAATEIACGAKLRQLAAAVMFYAQDNDGYFPPVTESLDTPPAVFPVAGTGPNAGKPAYLLRYVATSAPGTSNTGSAAMFICPLWLARSATNIADNTAGNGMHTYEYNVVLGGMYPPIVKNKTPYSGGQPFRPFAISKVRMSSQVPMFIDGSVPTNSATSLSTIVSLVNINGVGFGFDTSDSWETNGNDVVTHRVTYGNIRGRAIKRGVNNVAFVDGSVRPINVGTSSLYSRDRLSWDNAIFDPRNYNAAKFLLDFLP